MPVVSGHGPYVQQPDRMIDVSFGRVSSSSLSCCTGCAADQVPATSTNKRVNTSVRRTTAWLANCLSLATAQREAQPEAAAADRKGAGGEPGPGSRCDGAADRAVSGSGRGGRLESSGALVALGGGALPVERRRAAAGAAAAVAAAGPAAGVAGERTLRPPPRVCFHDLRLWQPTQALLRLRRAAQPTN
jgi:hypothetical protein